MTNPNSTNQREIAAALWDEFCDSLKRAGEVLRRPETPGDELTQAEGLRHLVRMIRAGFENCHEFADLDHPVLASMVERTLLYEGLTSDARYLHAFIDGTQTHVIRGHRGGAPLIEFGVYTGKVGIHEPSHLIASITEETLVVGDDGSLEVVLSPDEHPGNWIATDANTRYMMIRQYAHDWTDLRMGRFALHRQGATPAASPLSLEAIRQGLEGAVGFVQYTPRFWAGISDYWSDFSVNRFEAQLDADSRTDIAPPSGHQFSCAYLKLEPEEALILDFQPGSVPFWSLGLASYWYEPVGYGMPESHLNSGTASRSTDGSVQVVVSPQSVESDNWLATQGHLEGTLVFRWSRSKQPVPPISTRRVSIEEARALVGGGSR